MAVVDHQGQVIEETWAYPEAENPAGRNAILRLDALLAADEASLVRPLGVLLSSDSAVDTLVPHLDRLDLVAVEFPKFRDGRGFTIARTLRERHRFRGDIRALGHVLPDQFVALVRCGFSSILTPPEHPPGQWTTSAASPAGDGRQRAGPLLHRMVGRAVGPNASGPEADHG